MCCRNITGKGFFFTGIPWGITKFSQLSIFSTINNLTNISMDERYAAICGITEQELATDMAPALRACAGSR
ncbi:MAG: AAA family ATPase [Bacteroidales bacterium]|nr:AAA family ATPase [Bacteroidales bacterium]